MKVVIVDTKWYVAPRIDSVERHGRAVRLAPCGHNVYVSERGLEAVKRGGRELICEPCLDSLMKEHGAEPVG